MHEFNQSLKYDQRMHAADVAGSIAYAKGLARVGILTEEEQQRIVDGLTAVGKEWEQGTVSTRSFTLFSSLLEVTHSSKFNLTTKTSTPRTSVA